MPAAGLMLPRETSLVQKLGFCSVRFGVCFPQCLSALLPPCVLHGQAVLFSLSLFRWNCHLFPQSKNLSPVAGACYRFSFAQKTVPELF